MPAGKKSPNPLTNPARRSGGCIKSPESVGTRQAERAEKVSNRQLPARESVSKAKATCILEGTRLLIQRAEHFCTRSELLLGRAARSFWEIGAIFFGYVAFIC